MLISREQARRFINIGVNVRNRDVSSLVGEIQQQLTENLGLPAGYEIQYGGQFENLEHARNRLLVAVPIALALILLLLYVAFNSVLDTLIIFMAVPLSAVGGILALWLRDMPFSISSGIGFYCPVRCLSFERNRVAKCNKTIENSSDFPHFRQLISTACLSRLRPVLMTALVAALGFLPMALSTGSGAEVQRPLCNSSNRWSNKLYPTYIGCIANSLLYDFQNQMDETKCCYSTLLPGFLWPVQCPNLAEF